MYNAIKEVEKKLIQNAAIIPCERGGGGHRYFGIILLPTKYQTITGHKFTPYANPGALPTFPQNTTQYQIVQANTTHKEELKLWQEQ